MPNRTRLYAMLLACAYFVPAPRSQGPTPNPHWGASIVPAAGRELRASISLNRFTEFSSTGRPGDPDTKRFGSLDRFTTGFNMVDISHTDEIRLFDTRFTYTLNVGAGYSHNQPTRWLQNDYLHALRGLNFIPFADTRESSEYQAGGALTAWWGNSELHDYHEADCKGHATRYEVFAGGGIATSSIWDEAYLYVGGALLVTDWNLRFNFTSRVSWPHEADAFRNVANFTHINQVGITYVPDTPLPPGEGWFGRYFQNGSFEWSTLWPWHWPGAVYELLGRPTFGVWITHDSGIFLRDVDDPINLWFASVRVDWATGLRLETWNDFANGTDFGPSYGVMVSFDLFTLFGK